MQSPHPLQTTVPDIKQCVLPVYLVERLELPPAVPARLNRRLHRLLRGSTITPHATPIYASLQNGYWDRPNRSATWYAHQRPVKVCVLAEVVVADVLHGDDQLPRAFLDMHLLRETDRIALGDLMRLAHPPPPPGFVPATVTASLSMSAIRSILPATYDASLRLRPVRSMPTLQFTELRPGDIVMVEMYCTRTVYIDVWSTEFTLACVARLLKA